MCRTIWKRKQVCYYCRLINVCSCPDHSNVNQMAFNLGGIALDVPSKEARNATDFLYAVLGMWLNYFRMFNSVVQIQILWAKLNKQC